MHHQVENPSLAVSNRLVPRQQRWVVAVVSSRRWQPGELAHELGGGRKLFESTGCCTGRRSAMMLCIQVLLLLLLLLLRHTIECAVEVHEPGNVQGGV